MFNPRAATIPLGPNPNSFGSETPPDNLGAGAFQQGYPAGWGKMQLPVAQHIDNRVYGLATPPMSHVLGQRFFSPQLDSWYDWTGSNIGGEVAASPMTNWSEQA